MALSANTIWEVRAAGSDINGGGFVAGAAGTDYSQQDNPNTVGADISTTDGVGNGTTTFTSATANFGTTIVGNIISLSGGTGTLAQGWYQVTARASTSSITLDRAVAAGTGIVLTIGGALGSPGLLGATGVMTVSNMRAFIKAGTYIVTSATPNISGGTCSFTTATVSIEGYQTTRGDLGTKPLIQADGVITTFTMMNFGSFICKIRNVELDGNNRTLSRGFVSSGVTMTYRLTCRNFTNNAFAGSVNVPPLVECLATGCSTQPAFLTCPAYGCVASGNTVTGFTSTAGTVLSRCISYNNSGATSDGFLTSVTNAGAFVNCVAYGNGRDGFRLANNGTSAINCIAESNVGSGFNFINADSHLMNCAYFGNGTDVSLGSGIFNANYNGVLGTGSFFTNIAGSDFSLNDLPGQGRAARETGIPGIFPIATTSYLDIGAAQHTLAVGPPTITGTISHGHSSGSVASLTLSHTANGDNLLVAAVIFNGVGGGLSCTFNGVTMNCMIRSIQLGNYSVELYMLPLVAAVTANVVFTPVSGKFLALAAYNVHGNLSGVRVTVASANNSAPTITNTFYPDELILDIVASDNTNQTFTQTAGQTKLFDEVDVTTNVKIASSTKPTATSVTMSWTLLSSDFWTQFMIALIGATSGGSGGTPTAGEHSAVF